VVEHESETTQAPERRDSPRAPTSLRGKVFPGGVDCIIADGGVICGRPLLCKGEFGFA
jgi:hypothetical protein